MIIAKQARNLVLAIALSASLAVVAAGAASPAQAAPEPTAATSALTSKQIEEARSELAASSLLRVTDRVEGETVETYTLQGDTTISFTDRANGKDSRLGVGKDPRFFIRLSRADQTALASGSAAALGVALCAIPAVGWAACAAVVGALAVGISYIATRGGICPTSKPVLKIYTGTKVSGCVK